MKQPRSLLPALLLALFAVVPTMGIAQEQQSITLTRWDNTTQKVTLLGISTNGQKLNVRRNGTRQKVSLQNLLKISFSNGSSQPVKPIVVHLRDGGKLESVLRKSSSADHVKLKSPLLSSPVKLKLTQLDRVRFRGSEGRLDPSRRVDVKQNDVLYRQNGDIFRGFTTRIGPKKVLFKDKNLGKQTLPHKEVHQIDLAPIGSSPEVPSDVFLEVHGPDGSVLRGRPDSASGKHLTLNSFYEDVRWKIPLAGIQTILIKNGKTTYLSDLDPVRTVQRQVFPWQPDPENAPELPHRYRWRRDRAVPDQPDQDEPLTLDGKTYAKGIGCTAYTKLTYKLDEKFQSFQATIGIDDRARNTRFNGSVQFKVLVDGKTAYDSGVHKASWFPRDVNVDVSEAGRMSILVDLGSGYLDFANWAGARLIRRQ